MAKFRALPYVIDAIQWHGYNWKLVREWAGAGPGKVECISGEGERGFGTLYVKNRNDQISASYGDWIIKGVDGELRVCKTDIFEKSYSQVRD